MPAFMKLSPETIQELTEMTRGISLPHRGLLYVFFIHLLPGLKSKEIRKLISLAQPDTADNDFAAIIFTLNKHKLTHIYHSSGELYPPHPISFDIAKRWVKEPAIAGVVENAKISAQNLLHSTIAKGAEPLLPYKQLLLLLALVDYELTDIWKLINHIASTKPEAIDFCRYIPPTTFQKIEFLEHLYHTTFTKLNQIPSALHKDFVPNIYRRNAITHLPNILSLKNIETYTPEKHDAGDNISDVALHIALHTGNWEYFVRFIHLENTVYYPERKSVYNEFQGPQRTASLESIASTLQAWKLGKWAALKKLRDIFYYDSTPYENGNTKCDLPLRAVLAPLILMMRLKIANTHTSHVQQARCAMTDFYGNAATPILANFSQATDLEAKEFHLVDWQLSKPIDFLPKALCIALLSTMPDLPAAEIQELCEACTALHNSGLTMYSWYMANALLCIPTLTPQQASDMEEIFNSRQDLPLFCDIKKKTSIYDDLIAGMQNLLTASAPSSQSQKDGYISWRLSYQSRNKTVDYIAPYAHKKRKNGGYTTGKKILISDLLEGSYSDYTSDKDTAIVTHIHNQSPSSLWEIYYKVTPSLAELLIGHPHIILRIDNQESKPIELISESPTIEIKREKGSLKLRLQNLTGNNGVPIQQVEENTYAILCENDKAARLSRFIAQNSVSKNTLTVPDMYADRILSILSDFTDSVNIKGNVNNKKTKELTAQPKLIAFLTPGRGVLSGKLMLELYPEVSPVPLYSTGKVQFAHLQGNSIRITRSAEAENNVIEQAKAQCPNLFDATDEAGELQLELSDTMLHVVEELQNCDSKVLETRWQEGKAISISSMNDFSSFNITTSSAVNNWLNIGGEVQVNEQLVLQLSVLLQNISKSTGRYVELTNGHFLKLSKNIEDQLKMLSVLAGTTSKGRKVKKDVTISPALMLLLAQSDNAHTLPDALRIKAEQLQQQFSSNFYKPRNLNAELRDYQTDGYLWMQRLMNCGLGACLADDMGLGKTLQVLCVLLARAADGPSLVIAPASVCNNWSTEAAKFTPTLNVYQLENGNREELIKNLTKRDVLVCSYGLLVTEAELLTACQWNVVVLDEAQYIKNSQTQRARTACELKAKCRLAATGTPIENSLDELWSIFEFINPGYLGSQEQFRERFANNPARRKLLRRIVAPFVMRRLKGDVLDELPEKTETTRSITLSTQERALYEACRRDALLKAQESDDRFTILAQLMRLRRLCCHPQLIDSKWKAEAGKLTALTELASELKDSGHKALIFSQFTDMLSLVRKEFDKQGFSYLYLDGSTPKAKRGKLVDAFQDGEADFFLISLKAGGTGLNLTAADYVILLDPWWNPAVESQAADRTHRIGQKRPVTVCRFVCKDTIEERVMALHAEKRELFDQVINDTGKASPLSITELRELM